MSEFLKAKDVAPRLGLSVRRVYELMELGLIPIVRRGRAVRIPKAAFEQWLAMTNSTALASVQSQQEVQYAEAGR